MRVLQIAPEIGPGTGVGAVAHHLEQELAALGVTTERFTLGEARGTWLPAPGPGVRGKVALLARVVWFSTVGTVLARRRLAADPGLRSICHNDVVAGDVYVNHGILQASMAARGNAVWRLLRNPMHLFVVARDRRRYHGHAHRAVVSLSSAERRQLQDTYPRLRARTAVIGNGVDLVRYRPPQPGERAAARAALGLPDEAVVAVFVGHEFGRKGLVHVLDALPACDPSVRLVVVGGTEDMVAAARHDVAGRGLTGRVTFVGRRGDPRPFLHAGDALVLPSAYEAAPLVVVEALACGLPVVATAVGNIPDLVEDGVNGLLVRPAGQDVARALDALVATDRTALGAAARATAERHAWTGVARRYLDLLESL